MSMMVPMVMVVIMSMMRRGVMLMTKQFKKNNAWE